MRPRLLFMGHGVRTWIGDKGFPHWKAAMGKGDQSRFCLQVLREVEPVREEARTVNGLLTDKRVDSETHCWKGRGRGGWGGGELVSRRELYLRILGSFPAHRNKDIGVRA